MGFSLLNPGAAGLKSFSAGYAFRAGDVPAGMLPSCDLPAFQATVLNRWPDGSLRFALLSGQAGSMRALGGIASGSFGGAN